MLRVHLGASCSVERRGQLSRCRQSKKYLVGPGRARRRVEPLRASDDESHHGRGGDDTAAPSGRSRAPRGVAPDPFSVMDYAGNRSVQNVILDYAGSLRLLAQSLLDVESTFSCILSVLTVTVCHSQNLANGTQGLNANPSARHPSARQAGMRTLAPARREGRHTDARMLPATSQTAVSYRSRVRVGEPSLFALVPTLILVVRVRNGGSFSFSVSRAVHAVLRPRAVVFPLTFSLAEAFKRRETALMALAQACPTAQPPAER